MNDYTLSSDSFSKAFLEVDQRGWGKIDLQKHPPILNGSKLYNLMDKGYDSGKRGMYYNEIAFNWFNEWVEAGGIQSYHDLETSKSIFDVSAAKEIYTKIFGDKLAKDLLDLISQIKELCIEHHPDKYNRNLKLGRVLLRQMNEHETTNHSGSEWHEDTGYSNKPFFQYLSAAITLHGKPTLAEKYSPEVGQLLIFNNYHRRIDLKLSDDFAFKHKGPKSGPKLFLFFEFLIPQK